MKRVSLEFQTYNSQEDWSSRRLKNSSNYILLIFWSQLVDRSYTINILKYGQFRVIVRVMNISSCCYYSFLFFFFLILNDLSKAYARIYQELWTSHLSVWSSLFKYICLSVCYSVCLFIYSLSVYLFAVCLFIRCLSIYSSVCVSVCLS